MRYKSITIIIIFRINLLFTFFVITITTITTITTTITTTINGRNSAVRTEVWSSRKDALPCCLIIQI